MATAGAVMTAPYNVIKTISHVKKKKGKKIKVGQRTVPKRESLSNKGSASETMELNSKNVAYGHGELIFASRAEGKAPL